MVIGFVWWWPAGIAILAAIRSRLAGLVLGFPSSHGRFVYGSGNAVFNDTAPPAPQLEQEQNEFGDFIANLKKAKDKAEFDQFMTKRKRKTK